MTAVRIVADDLTGALDSAAPLAALAGALPVFWRHRAVEGAQSFALDTESRDTPPAPPLWLDAFAGAELAYKKIDSLLRGNTAHEIAACLGSGRFAHAVIAPAFPAQQRITRGGRQYWRPAAAEPWQAVPCHLLSELRRQGIEVRLAAAADEVAVGGFAMCDARSEDDLRALAAAGRRLAGPVLWVGSAGLARALAMASAEGTLPRLEPPLLIIIGSHHPVTLAQIAALKVAAPELVVEVRPGDHDLETALAGLAGRDVAALVLAVPDGTGAARARPFFERALAALAARLMPRSLVVSGGATLHRLVDVVGARSLLVSGEPLPGVPCSVLQGGLWDRATVISKSGGFGEPALLIRLADCAKG